MRTDAEAALMQQIDEAFAASKLGLGCRLQVEYRKRFGRDPLPENVIEAMPYEGPALHVGQAYARTGETRQSGASKRR